MLRAAFRRWSPTITLVTCFPVFIAFFASVLAPTVKVGVSVTVGAVIDREIEARHALHTRFQPPIRQ